jgi:hypothetical protein
MEFSELQQGGMIVNEYLNKFTQMSRYGLNDEIQFQLLNTNNEDFQRIVDKAIIVKNKIKVMEKNGKRKMSFPRQSSGSNTRPRLPQPGPFVRNSSIVHPLMYGPNFQAHHPTF